MHVIAAKAVAFGEALRPDFKEYSAAVVRNAQALGDAMAEAGLRLVSGGTDNHLVLVDLTSMGISGKDDVLPKRLLTAKPDGKAKGKIPDLGKMLPEYYRLRGWDDRGIPTKERLKELDLV